MKERGMIRARFDKGQIPTIACFNKATVPLGIELDTMLRALQKFVDRCVVPVWGTPAKLVESTGFVRKAWALVFLDDVDQPGALAYHDLTPDGLPISKVFTASSLKSGLVLEHKPVDISEVVIA